jgi:hypothetical protein
MDLSSMLGVGGLTTPDLCSGMRNFIPQGTVNCSLIAARFCN